MRSLVLDEPIDVPASAVVVDTSVLTDMLVADRPRHAVATQLVNRLLAEHRMIVVPTHALFELLSAIVSERKAKGSPLALPVSLNEDWLPVPTIALPITLGFVRRYLVEPLERGLIIDHKAGDAIFIAIAAVHGLRLISEDARMRGAAERAGVDAVDMHAFLSGG